MFSGIVESVQAIEKALEQEGLIRIHVARPVDFTDLKAGDSVAIDGICLTLESFSDTQMQFALAAETLKILRWPDPARIVGRRVNLERSLRYGDRIHGHLVSGHVDSLATVVDRREMGGSLFLSVRLSPSILPFVWKKGSVTLNGVSLTVNDLNDSVVEVCLIPETLKRTNLGDLREGATLNVEPDWMAKAMNRALELKDVTL